MTRFSRRRLIWLLRPLSCQQSAFLSQSSHVAPVEWEGERGGAGRSQIIWPEESMVLYKSLNTLCLHPPRPLVPCLLFPWGCLSLYTHPRTLFLLFNLLFKGTWSRDGLDLCWNAKLNRVAAGFYLFQMVIFNVEIDIAPHLICFYRAFRAILDYLSENWMIYWGQSFLSSDLAPHLRPLPSACRLSFSVFLCVVSQAYWRERGWGKSQIIPLPEDLVAYISFNILCHLLSTSVCLILAYFTLYYK